MIRDRKFIIMQMAMQTGALANCQGTFRIKLCVPVLQVPNQSNILENKSERSENSISGTHQVWTPF